MSCITYVQCQLL